MRLFSKNFGFYDKMKKKAHLSLILLGWQNGLHIRKERPIFDLGLSWFVFVTLETSCIKNISKKPLGRWNDVANGDTDIKFRRSSILLERRETVGTQENVENFNFQNL